jgi:formate dehydrogenase gamma subunit
MSEVTHDVPRTTTPHYRELVSLIKIQNLLYLPLALVLLFGTARIDAQMTNDECLGCHGDPTATKDAGGGKTTSVHVDPAKFGESVHSVLDCASCHADIKTYPHEPAPAKVSCNECHSDAVTAHGNGIHATAMAKGNGNAASCLSCHGGPHQILPSSNPAAPTARSNIPKTCGSCHSLKFVMESSGLSSQPIFSYGQSVHGRAVAAGSKEAAVCTDCHAHHEILSPRDQKSPINKFNIPNTCGKCHENQKNEFVGSVHGKAVERGNSQSPVCTDCHGIHNIKSHIDPNSSVAAQQVARTTCGQCHGDVKLTQEFGVAGGRVSSYEDSYHGLAKQLGSDVAANCASCHGVHNILPSSDPKATTNKANLVKTCGQCHPGASTKFAEGKVHLEESPQGDFTDKLLSWIRRIYIFLIVATIGFMLFHNGLIWFRKAQAKKRNPRRVVVRMNRNQRLQHAGMAISFTVLVISGFALAYPTSMFAWITGDEASRRIIHRIAAVVMMVVGIYHILYMVSTKEGRKGLVDFWLRWKDAKDLFGTLRYYAGLSKTKPQAGRFGYPEKIEYWAMIWGTIVMAVTGLMLWFSVMVTMFVPRWWVDVALTVHLYEAILATLAIIVWHFYHVIFDPDIYPMSFTWLDGKMTPEEYEHEHPLAYQEWKKEHGELPMSDNDGHGPQGEH